MHRALGGAPTLSVQRRSLGRSLRANVRACAVRLCPAKNGAASVQNKYFLGKVVRFSALSHAKNYSGRRYAEPLALSASKPLGRAWCGHARPTTTLAASKNKKENFRKEKALIICYQ